MYHHDNRNYAVAASEAATKTRAKFEALIEKGERSAAVVIEQIMGSQPIDRVVPGKVVGFAPSATGITVENREKPGEAPIHDHALGQIAAKLELPWKYADTLRGTGWGRELLSVNLNELMQRTAGDSRFLLRFAKRDQTTELRGFLFDKYRRLDARPITDAFARACSAVGALPYEGVASDTRIAVRAILPMLFEPVPNEILAFGVDFSTSDYGDGALSVAGFVMRCWCTNLATMEDVLRQVHLGRRLSDDLTFSQETYALDTKTMSSAVGDIVSGILAPAKVEEYCAVVKAADGEKIDARQIGERMKRLGLTKAEQEATVQAFNSPDIEQVPAGQSVYRLANAVSWVAGHASDARRKLEMQKMSGNILLAG